LIFEPLRPDLDLRPNPPPLLPLPSRRSPPFLKLFITPPPFTGANCTRELSASLPSTSTILITCPSSATPLKSLITFSASLLRR
uniref:Ovule protein n=1 Tax=Haemonchus placei TaxID=6290 RepID=A0A0N4WIL3_HAEPC